MSDNWGLYLVRFISHNWQRTHWRILFLHDVPQQLHSHFNSLLDWFSQYFEWVSLDSGVEGIISGNLVRPSLTLTFDDAHKSLVDVVPLLAERCISACVYVVPEYVENGKSFSGHVGQPIMSWRDLREWRQAGHAVGSHSLSHPALTNCSDEELHRQFLESRQRLEDALGEPVEHFAYPFGQFDHRTQTIVRKLGCYRSVATSERGPMYPPHDPLSLRRDRVNITASPAENEMWMRLADRLYCLRHLKRAIRKLWAQKRSRCSMITNIPATAIVYETMRCSKSTTG